LKGANRFNDQQIRLFDEVLMQLVERIEAKALSELSPTFPTGAPILEFCRQNLNRFKGR
jgi:hypothetical protein